MKKLLEFKNVSISFDGGVLYKNINFTIYEGDRYMLLGKNGSGKSLLLELIALGYTNDLKNRYKGLKVTGELLDSNNNNLLDPKNNRNFAYVTQNENFYNNSTIYSEAESACNGIGIDLDDKKLDYYLKKFDLSHKKHTKLKNNVSYGEGKIVHLITRLLKLDVCDVLLLDEPLNHLSFQNSKKFNDVINDLIKEKDKLTIIMVSHCKAINFVNKTITYDGKETFDIRKYQNYDCFE